MAFYVKIHKLSEDDDFAYYEYEFSYPREPRVRSIDGVRVPRVRFVNGVRIPREALLIGKGKIKIAKYNGDTFLIELADGDTGAQAKWASRALMRHWKKGEYPEVTYAVS